MEFVKIHNSLAGPVSKNALMNSSDNFTILEFGIFLSNIYYFFFNCQIDRKKQFQIKRLFSFSSAYSEKKIIEKISESI